MKFISEDDLYRIRKIDYTTQTFNPATEESSPAVRYFLDVHVQVGRFFGRKRWVWAVMFEMVVEDGEPVLYSGDREDKKMIPMIVLKE